MFVTKFYLLNFSYTILVTQFQLHNFSYTILVTKFQLHNFSYKILVTKFQLQNFSYNILVTLTHSLTPFDTLKVTFSQTLPTDGPTDRQLDFQSCSGQLKKGSWIPGSRHSTGLSQSAPRGCMQFKGMLQISKTALNFNQRWKKHTSVQAMLV